MAQLTVQIITPERTVFDGQADGVTLPATTGELTILPGHLPLITLLRSGEITLHAGQQRRHMAIHGGFMEIDNDVVKLLTDAAEPEEEIDERRAAEALERARRAKEEATTHHEQAEALAAIERAVARLQLAERRKQRHRA
ncbi:ATP synthase F1 subunit epsilon [Candidatus Berkelbacteria bacterium]|nr:ATP synthase F1 subunit epsilon [Candidatus Berkelbacteria bacterium]